MCSFQEIALRKSSQSVALEQHFWFSEDLSIIVKKLHYFLLFVLIFAQHHEGWWSKAEWQSKGWKKFYLAIFIDIFSLILEEIWAALIHKQSSRQGLS